MTARVSDLLFPQVAEHRPVDGTRVVQKDVGGIDRACGSRAARRLPLRHRRKKLLREERCERVALLMEDHDPATGSDVATDVSCVTAERGLDVAGQKRVRRESKAVPFVAV